MRDEHKWFITCADSKLLINKLNRFFTEHQALSQELSEAKPLGTCKISTSQDRKYAFRSLDSMLRNGKCSTRIVTTHTRGELRLN